MAVNPYSDSTEAQLDTLASLANSKGLYGSPYTFNSDNWLNELQRLRSNLSLILNGGGYDYIDQYVFGPWPVQGVAGEMNDLSLIHGTAYPDGGPYELTYGALKRVWFYAFGDEAPSVDAIWAAYAASDNTTVPIPDEPTSTNNTIRIGGPQTVRAETKFRWRIDRKPGASGSPTVTQSTNFPGVTSWSVVDYGDGVFRLESNDVDEDVDPGAYSFSASITGTDFYFFNGGAIECYPTIRITTTVANGVAAAGIHSSKDVWRVDVSAFDELDYSFGVWVWFREKDYVDVNGDPYTAPGYYGLSTSPAWIASTAGLWVAKNKPISAMPMAGAFMPWNPLQSSGANKGDPTGATVTEMRTQPAAGDEVASPRSTAVTAGKYTAGGEAYHVALNNGTTGPTEPTWNDNFGGTTIDGTVEWRNFGPVKPAVARGNIIPTWPVYRYGRPNPYASLASWSSFHDPAGATSSHNRFWFIHRVRINRILPITGDQYHMDGTGSLTNKIDVQIGCIRNGSFVSFGTFQTGEWAQDAVSEIAGAIAAQHRVMWPIFENDALVYVASEVVDIQAEICWFPSIGYGVDLPALAEHYNSTQSLLMQFP